MITAVPAHGLRSFIPDPRAKVCWLRASLVSCEAVLVSLPWFFHWDLLFQVEIPRLPEKRVLSEVQHRHAEALFPLVVLYSRDLSCSSRSKLLPLLRCLLFLS